MNKKNCNVGCPDCEEVRKNTNETKKYNVSTNKPQYKCAICGKPHDTIEGRINCETKCLKARNEAEKKRKEHEHTVQKENRLAEVNAAYEKFTSLKDAFLKDYGYWSYCSESNIKKEEPFTLLDWLMF